MILTYKEYEGLKKEEERYNKKHKRNLVFGGIALGLVAIFSSFIFPLGIIYDYLIKNGVKESMATDISFWVQLGLIFLSGIFVITNTVYSYVNKNKMIAIQKDIEELIKDLYEEKESLLTRVTSLEVDLFNKIDENNDVKEVKDMPNEEVLDLSDEKLLELINDSKNEHQLLRLKTLYQTLNAIDKNGKFSEEEKNEHKNNLRAKIYRMATGEPAGKTLVKKK